MVATLCNDPDMNTFSQLIDECGGAPIVSGALGIPDSHVRTMKARNSIPVEYWERVIDLAAAQGVEGVTFKRLLAMRSGEQARAS